jgi:hypothetical protein
MAYGMFPQIDPAEMAQYQMRDAYSNGAQGGGVAGGIMSALGAMRQYQPEPRPITVSGSSVIGLTPDQTSHLLDRVSRENELNTQMHQHRIDTMNADMRAQRGEVLRAAEAEMNRRHADTLEEKRLNNQIYMEGLKAGKPDVKPIASMPGYAVVTQPDETGKPVSSVQKLPGADALPPTDKGGTWVDTYGPDGTVIKKHIGINDTAQVAPAPENPDRVDRENLRMVADMQKEFQKFDQVGPDGKPQPITPEMANSLANIWVANKGKIDTSRLSFNNQPVSLVPRDKTKPSRLVEQTMPDGSKVWVVPQEGQVAKPAPTPTADEVMKKEYGTTWAKYLEANKDNPEALQRAVQTLANHGISEDEARAILPEQMKDTWGSYIGWGDQTKRWTWPATQAAPGAPIGSGGYTREQALSAKPGTEFTMNGKKYRKRADGALDEL